MTHLSHQFISNGYLKSVNSEERPKPFPDPYGIAQTNYRIPCHQFKSKSKARKKQRKQSTEWYDISKAHYNLLNQWNEYKLNYDPLIQCTVEMRNLPSNTTTADIKYFFRSLYIDERNITINDSKAWIRFNDRRDLHEALKFNNRIMCSNRIYMSPSIGYSKHDHQDNQFKSNSKDMMKQQKAWADSYDIAKTRIDNDIAFHLNKKENMKREQWKKRKMEARKENMMTETRERNTSFTSAKRDAMVTAGRLPNHRINFCVKVDGFPATVTNQCLTQYFSGCGAHPYCIHSKLAPNRQNAGEAYIEFSSRKCYALSLTRDGDYIQNSRISVKPIAFEAMLNIVQKRPPIDPLLEVFCNHNTNVLPSKPNVEHLMDKQRAFDGLNLQNAGQKSDITDRVVIAFIPYNINGPSIKDICEFFFSYGITERCISRRSDNGRQKADVSITFKSKEHASDAVKQMHKKFLWGKPVHLRLLI